MSTFQNPIIPGFYPDPSICRVGEDYYLVTSSFEYFPGLPIFHSHDLVNWQQIGHVLDRPSQLNLDGIAPSRGLYAPTIRHHDGTFYVINTLVGSPGENTDAQNFIVTADDPAGDWSDPHWLHDAPGIDPSLLFDADGRVWYTGNRVPDDARYPTHREIWLQELNLETMQLVGDVFVIWDGAMVNADNSEAPHIYKISDYYYLLTAEGGTGFHHAIVVARSRNITGPYESCKHNPLLTHRHMGQHMPITGPGHADLIETQTGQWWAVMLAMRPYGGYYYNLGRETFLAPVIWENDWPVISPGTGQLEQRYTTPNLSKYSVPSTSVRDHFDADTLADEWNFIRTPRKSFWSLTARPSHLRLKLRPERITEWVNPSFIGRRQQHQSFTVRVAMAFTPSSENDCAGIVLLQNNDYQFRCVVRLVDGQRVIQLIRRENGEDSIRGEMFVNADHIILQVSALGQRYRFAFSEGTTTLQSLSDAENGRILSTPVAGGFVGTYIGMYASSNGHESDNHADFDWFTYQPESNP